jgi:hypothetical protein
MFKVIPITPPKGTLSAAKYKRAVKQAQGIAEVAGLNVARGITRGWSHKVAWSINRKGDDESEIVTDDEIFIYQAKGTKGPYPIRPRTKRALFWKGAAHPVKRVSHPGLKAQRFSERIAATMQKQYKRIMDEQIKAVIP